MLKKLIILVSCFVTIALLAIGLSGCFNPDNSDTILIEDQYTNDFNVIIDDQKEAEIIYKPSLFLSSGVASVSETGSVSKVVTATLEPADAENRGIEWILFWTIPPVEGADINDYFSFEAKDVPAGSNCTITCFKAFNGGEAVLRARTLDGGFTADCTLIYAGVPTDVWLEFNNLPYRNLEKVDVSTSNSFKSFTINLDNVLGEIGADYRMCSISSVKLIGKMDVYFSDTSEGLGKPNIAGQTGFIRYDFDSGIGTVIYETALGDEIIGNTFEIDNDEAINNGFSISSTDFVETRFVNSGDFGVLQIKPTVLFTGFLRSSENTHLAFKSFPDEYAPVYVQIVLHIPGDLPMILKVNPVTGVTSITLSQTNIMF